ncbi:tRNA (N6-threonylcarbamoyladenosine(37)-N6)-methyltransferase TrmO [Archaeoglobales archaeon]|nr:MAG: tRNA (N6-threonylcarbamoyladenosine(37)-N6)-methyltransferase TrmO [Archaeoglobales archaeon]
MEEIIYRPIGIIYSPFKEPKGTPIQPAAAKGVRGKVEVFDEYVEGLKDIDGFSHIILVYHFHLSRGYSLMVKPFLDDEMRGVFATRAPRRPNPIGLSIVRLVSVKENILHIEDVDIVDKTPLLDIKPYVPEFDSRKAEKIGWIAKNIHKLPELKADERFVK